MLESFGVMNHALDTPGAFSIDLSSSLFTCSKLPLWKFQWEWDSILCMSKLLKIEHREPEYTSAFDTAQSPCVRFFHFVISSPLR